MFIMKESVMSFEEKTVQPLFTYCQAGNCRQVLNKPGASNIICPDHRQLSLAIAQIML